MYVLLTYTTILFNRKSVSGFPIAFTTQFTYTHTHAQLTISKVALNLCFNAEG